MPKDRQRVVWINIDALKPDVFYDLLDRGQLPNFGSIFLKAKRALSTVSVFPTVTMASQASLITGAYPGRHLITANGWFDRYGKHPTHRDYTTPESAVYIFKYRMYGPPTGLLPSRRGSPLGNHDLSGATQTVFDAVKSRSVRSAVTYNIFNRGASDWIRPTRLNLFQLYLGYRYRKASTWLDKSVASRTIYFINDENRLPRLLQFYFPGLDCFSHGNGPDKQEEFLKNTLDPIFGRVLKALAKHQSLEQYYFVLTSDHGQSKISGDPSRAISFPLLGKMMDSIGRTHLVPNTHQNPKHASSIIMPQGGSLLLYIRNEQTRRWYDVPRLQYDLIDTAKALAELNEREFEGLAPGWIDLILINDREHESYLVADGKKVYEPEKYFAAPANRNRYPDAVRRLHGLQGKRCPDLILLSNYDRGFHFGKPNDLGQHGGLCRDDSMVPLIFSGPGISEGSISGETSVLDVAPTIASIYNVRLLSADGNVLPLFD